MSEIIDLIAGEMQKQAAQVLNQREGLPPKLVNVFGFKRNQDDANQDGGENIITSQQGGENNNDNSNSIEVIQESAPATGQTRSSASTGMGSGPVIDNRNYGFKSAAASDWQNINKQTVSSLPETYADTYSLSAEDKRAIQRRTLEDAAQKKLDTKRSASTFSKYNPFNVTSGMARKGWGVVPTTAYNSLLYALTGGALSGLGTFIMGDDENIGRNAIIGASLGGILGVPSGQQIWQSTFKKTASDPLSQLIDKINSDYSMSSQDKSSLILKLQTLSKVELSNILNQVAPIVGMGVGAAIARFILGAGIVGSLVGGLVGSEIGNMFRDKSNPAMKDLVKVDAFGNLIV